MSTESKEHLSSFMDGEFSKETGRFLVRRLGADGELRETWARYHLVRDCLRHQDGSFAQSELSRRVYEGIAKQAKDDEQIRKPNNWLKPFVGAAVAASVALLAVLTVSQGTQDDLQPVESAMATASSVESFTSPNILAVSPASRPVNLSGRSDQGSQKMNSYLLRHYQVSGESGGKGFVSFVPIVVAQVSGQPAMNEDDATPDTADLEKDSESVQR